ncbi:MAG: CvpA family protein [Bacillota bacterium]
MNYADIIIGCFLALGFIKGFLTGFWASVLGLAGTVVGFLGAYFFTGPVVNYLEHSAGWVSHISEWWKDVFILLPSYAKPYDPNSVAEFFQGIDSTPWLRPISALLKDYFLEIEVLAGPGATWGRMLALLLAQIVVASVVFFVLLSLIRIAWSFFARTLSFATSLSFAQRFLGGLLQLGLSVVWLSLVVGSLYPLIGLESLGQVRDIVSSSQMVAVLLGVYKVLLPAALSRIKPKL